MNKHNWKLIVLFSSLLVVSVLLFFIGLVWIVPHFMDYGFIVALGLIILLLVTFTYQKIQI